MVDRNSAPEDFACIWQSKRVGIITIETAKMCRRVRTHEKKLRRNCLPIGHNNTKHFLFPIRSRRQLEFLEIARWESVPRGSFARTWKLSSRLFSRPDWLPLGLQRWLGRWTRRNTIRLKEISVLLFFIIIRFFVEILTISLVHLKSRKTLSREDSFSIPWQGRWMWP